MEGKQVFVTGANSGIGLATSMALASRGFAVNLVCRDPERGRSAEKAIANVATGPPPALLIADLSSQREIRLLAEEIHARYSWVDVLVNNAGGCFERRTLTVDGIERTFATNHLAPFLLTSLLLDLLRASPQGRVVTVGSEGHSGKLDFDNLQGEKRYNFLSAYNRSKLANVLHTYELTRRLEGSNVGVNCVSPGPARTGFGDNMKGMSAMFPKIMKRMPFFADPEKAALGPIYLAASPEAEGVTGRFYLRTKERRSKAISYDLDVAARLWRVSEELTEASAGMPGAMRKRSNGR